jgi:hypothetical protein
MPVAITEPACPQGVVAHTSRTISAKALVAGILAFDSTVAGCGSASGGIGGEASGGASAYSSVGRDGCASTRVCPLAIIRRCSITHLASIGAGIGYSATTTAIGRVFFLLTIIAITTVAGRRLSLRGWGLSGGGTVTSSCRKGCTA